MYLENINVGAETVHEGVVGSYEFIAKTMGSKNRLSLKIKNVLNDNGLTLEGKMNAVRELVNKYN